ncbi:MAG: sialidase family protein [Actinomycetes bacterium]
MQRSGGTWATVGLVVLAVVAAVLAYSAMQNTAATTPAPLSSALTNPTDDATATNEPKPGKNVTDAIPETLEPPLLMVDADLAFRGRTGTCLGGANLERTTNGGGVWRPLEVPASAILDLRSTGGDVEVVGADERCRVRVWNSTDRGQTWSDPVPATDTFVRLPSTTRDIVTPSGLAMNPCPDRKVAPLAVESISATDGAVLCFDGEVRTTADAGVTWSEGATVAGAQALAFEGPSLGWVLVRDGGRCPVYEAQITQDGGTTWQLGGCLGIEASPDKRVLPSISFSTPQVGLADLAGETYVTPDSASTWRQAR